jgi:putative flippase GtrA
MKYITKIYKELSIKILGEYYSFTELVYKKNENVRVQLLRSLMVAAVAFVVDFGVLIILTSYFQVNYLLSAAISFSLGLVVNYLLSVAWVFTNRKLSKKHHELVVFVIIGIIGLCLNDAIMWLFTGKLLFDYRISKLISTGIVFFWNFGARKYILY